ncbi:uncharacterized protein TNIN_70441 [Trichonephila inaurata madagascariensis]|uniref:Uncharacterized protein n=1 Tax=Trichonephila inaurata madagascariensis TaxID=2747483 RepID=A0A8X6X9Z2_9ARAC|nr:uncharacterized protein TNIN_70441 [Trichonephila inaurata madagascariensis]
MPSVDWRTPGWQFCAHRKGGYFKAWSISSGIHNLPSDIESDESSLSEAEDVMTAKSSSSENTDIDEEKGDINVPGPSHIFKVTWKNKVSVKIRNMPFTEQSEPSEEITSL